jgi:hypothetical protein
VGFAHISDPIVGDLPGMTMWTGLGDNTELFWAVLSHPTHCQRPRNNIAATVI